MECVVRKNASELGIYILSVCMFALPAAAADWPMWRCDAARTAASPEDLPRQLRLQWTRKLPPFQPAWPNEPRLHFDACYEPAVMGKKLFIGSPNDGSVTAFDTETGEQQWKFYTEGPVRFAPAASNGKIYVASDDGYLYCLDADKGETLWKARGASADRPDRRHLGNARLISYWPVRGGPVLADGVVYFAAGLWPTLGVFIHAVDADTGNALWVNDSTQYLDRIRIDHNTLFEVGLSPQGHMAVVGDKLIVPNGRSMPARLDRKTGALLYYVQGYRNGDCRVTAAEKYLFVGDSGVVNVHDGREVGSRWLEAGAEAPDKFDARKFDLFEGPMFGYKVIPACNAHSVLAGNIVYGSHKGVFYAYDLERPQTSLYDTKFQDHSLRPARWDPPLLWQFQTKHANPNVLSRALIKAGNRLYGHANATLLALDLPPDGGQPEIAWEQPIDGTPASMLAADGKLIVTTKEGGIHCFGEGTAEPKTHALETRPLPDTADQGARHAAEILEAAGVSEGYCVVLGLGDGRLMEEILAQSKLRVIGVDADGRKVNALRDRLVAAGLYGRAQVFLGEPFDFPLPPYLASLIVTGEGFPMETPVQKIFSVLRPYGGTACLRLPALKQEAFAAWAASGTLQNADVGRCSEFATLRRSGPLPGSAAWTHETGDAARSYCSADDLIRTPLGILWYGDGADHGFFKDKDYGVGVKPQGVGGRLFAFQVQSRTLHAIDVYTGRLLWKQKVEHFTRYASLEDGVYVAGRNQCVVLDPATGEPRATFSYELTDLEGRAPDVMDIRVSDDIIVIAADFGKVRSIEKGLWNSTVLVALDRRSGEKLWQQSAKDRFNIHAVAIGGGMVFCADSPAPLLPSGLPRTGEASQPSPSIIMALDARTGELKWQHQTERRLRSTSWLSIMGNDDWLAYSPQADLLLTGKAGHTIAFAARTGKEVWQQPIGGQPIILRGDTFINQSGYLYDTATGRQLSTASFWGKRGGCNYSIGGRHLLFARDNTACYVDLQTRVKHYLRNIRSGCSNSFVPADGVLNCPCFSVGCVCNYPLQTSFAMTHMPEVAPWAGDSAVTFR